MEIVFLVVVVVLWVSIGMTEGYKWTNTPTFVTSKNYHIVRGVTNAMILLLPLVSFGMDVSLMTVLSVVWANITAWAAYELALNYVNFGNPFHQKKEFVIGNRVFKHPPVWANSLMGLCALVLYMAMS
jgi:hypothetical protein